MNSTPERRMHAKVTGRVQGVGFRYFVLREAQSLGLTGWVRNRWDGSVEVVAEGDVEELRSLAGALEKGPPSSSVTKVDTDLQTASGEFGSFHVRSTI
ncbi:MAG: acylphosphatase [Anaerolineales bacterium]